MSVRSAEHDRRSATVLRPHPVHRPVPGSRVLLVLGDSSVLVADGFPVLDAHPNTVAGLARHPEDFLGLVVDATALGGVWSGALSGSDPWKSYLVQQACQEWRRADRPVLLLHPERETAPLAQWTDEATEVLPSPSRRGTVQEQLRQALEERGITP